MPAEPTSPSWSAGPKTIPDIPQAANTAFIIDLPADGWNDVREIETMHGSTGHSEILIEDLRVHNDQMLGGAGKAICWANTAWGRRAWRIACAGLPKLRWRWT